MADYPNSVPTFATVVDGVDDVLAAHQNTPNGEITAIATELGTLPKGAAADVKTRLDDISSGWTKVSDTWLYASASTITLPTNATLTYQKNDFIRWKQGGGYKYGVFSAVAATLGTIVVNTDYTVANAAITDVAYSRSPNPFGFPKNFNYTTVITSLTGTITAYSVTKAKYSIVGGEAAIYLHFTITTNGTGATAIVATHPLGIEDTNGVFREAAGVMCYGATQSGNVYIRKYDETYPGADGKIFKGSVKSLLT